MWFEMIAKGGGNYPDSRDFSKEEMQRINDRKKGALEELEKARKEIDRLWRNNWLDGKTCAIIKDDILLKRIKELKE